MMPDEKGRLYLAHDDVLNELISARDHFPPMRSAHEGYAIILEEMEELWTEVKNDKRSVGHRKALMRKEATQVAAMALAFMVECC